MGSRYYLRSYSFWFCLYSVRNRCVFTQDCGLGYQVNYAPEALPLEALEQAIGCAKDNLAGLIHHTDHGSQYVSIKYSQRLTDAGIRSSTGTIGDSYDNALAETVNGLYKTELIYSQTWRSCTEVEWATLNWVYRWNHQRLHESLDYSTPEEVITQYNQTHAKQLAPT